MSDMYPNSTIEAISNLLFLETPITPCEIAIVFGNDYVGTMDEVKNLWGKGMIKNKIILSGHSAKKDKKPEAIRFMEYGLQIGLPKERMLLETEATNTLENLLYSRKLIETELGNLSSIKSIMFVAKAFVCRRIQMTIQAIYPSKIDYVYYPVVDVKGRNIGKDCWWETEEAIKRVLEELRRISEYTLKGDLSLFQKEDK
ncbi:MAG: YdcF family protein [Lachnospiraceae bacterium]|jgi:hypothetical protein|nr:YdcF family protein [Lachnospiraceae bacterium]